jgi:hypothetical protein
MDNNLEIEFAKYKQQQINRLQYFLNNNKAKVDQIVRINFLLYAKLSRIPLIEICDDFQSIPSQLAVKIVFMLLKNQQLIIEYNSGIANYQKQILCLTYTF